MSTRKLSQWIDKKTKGLRDAVEKLHQQLGQLGGQGDLEPIPIRIDDPERPRRRR